MDVQLEIRKILKDELLRLKSKNSAYSLRAFARSLGIVPSALSEFLSSDRPITAKMGKKILSRLSLPPNRYRDLVQALEHDPNSGVPGYIQMDMDQHYIITDWHYYAVLSLLEIKGFKEDPKWIAKRLNITIRQAQQALTRLERIGMLKRNTKNELVNSGKQFTTSTDIVSSAIRQRHLSNLDLAKTSLEKDPVEIRDFSEITMAIDTNKMPKAKEIIKKFRRDLCRLMEKSDQNEVYKLCIQLFPLSEKDVL